MAFMVVIEKEIHIGKIFFDLSWKMLEPTNYETDYNSNYCVNVLCV